MPKISNVAKVNSLAIASVVFFDLVSKFLIKQKIFFDLPVIENPGLPFGINLPRFFSLLVVVLLLFFFIFCYQRYLAEAGSTLGFSLIVGGAISNILDRLGDFKVTDFINLGVSMVNLADLAILIGIGFLLIPKPKA